MGTVMSDKLDMTSINSIKELVSRKEYPKALEILDTLDIEKSMNPQFLRLCGEIYTESGRYLDSRKILVKAHKMAPQGTRILYELVRLYVRMGYFTKAKIYSEQYFAVESVGSVERSALQYMIRKAQKAPDEELIQLLEELLKIEYVDEWAFELALMYSKVGEKQKSDDECAKIKSTFRNSMYANWADALQRGKLNVKAALRTVAEKEVPENLKRDKEVIEEENKQLERDRNEIFVEEVEPIIDIDEEEQSEEENEGGEASEEGKSEEKKQNVFSNLINNVGKFTESVKETVKEKKLESEEKQAKAAMMAANTDAAAEEEATEEEIKEEVKEEPQVIITPAPEEVQEAEEEEVEEEPVITKVELPEEEVAKEEPEVIVTPPPVVEEEKAEPEVMVTPPPAVEEEKAEPEVMVTPPPVVEEEKAEPEVIVTPPPVVEEKVEPEVMVTPPPVVEEEKAEPEVMVTPPPVVEEEKAEPEVMVTPPPVVEEVKVEPEVMVRPPVEEEAEAEPEVIVTPVVEEEATEEPEVVVTPVVEEEATAEPEVVVAPVEEETAEEPVVEEEVKIEPPKMDDAVSKILGEMMQETAAQQSQVQNASEISGSELEEESLQDILQDEIGTEKDMVVPKIEVYGSVAAPEGESEDSLGGLGMPSFVTREEIQNQKKQEQEKEEEEKRKQQEAQVEETVVEPTREDIFLSALSEEEKEKILKEKEAKRAAEEVVVEPQEEEEIEEPEEDFVMPRQEDALYSEMEESVEEAQEETEEIMEESIAEPEVEETTSEPEVEPELEEVSQEVAEEQTTEGATIDTPAMEEYFHKYLIVQSIKPMLEDAMMQAKAKGKEYRNLVLIRQQNAKIASLAVDFAKVYHEDQVCKEKTIAVIKASVLNNTELTAAVPQLRGGCLIVENAGLLSREKSLELVEVMKDEKADLTVILTADFESVSELFVSVPEFAPMFHNLLELQNLTVNELFQIARAYVSDKGYNMDVKAQQKMYERLASMEIPDLDDTKEMVDKAISSSQKREMKRLTNIVFNNAYQDSGVDMLLDVDF